MHYENGLIKDTCQAVVNECITTMEKFQGLLYQLSDRVQAVVSSTADKARKRLSELLKSVNGTLKQQADIVPSGNNNATVATAAARDEAAASVPQPEDSAPIAIDEYIMLTVNHVAVATGNNDDDNDKDNRKFRFSSPWVQTPFTYCNTLPTAGVSTSIRHECEGTRYQWEWGGGYTATSCC